MNRKPNINLKIASIKAGISFFQISRETGIHHSRISQIANAWVTPNETEKDKIAQVLNVEVNDIFPETSVD